MSTMAPPKKGKLARALLIDPKERVIKAIQLERSLEALQEMVGGYIELGVGLENGDVLYVDEEGGNKPNRPFIIGAGRCGPLGFVGRGLLVGQESASGRISDVK